MVWILLFWWVLGISSKANAILDFPDTFVLTWLSIATSAVEEIGTLRTAAALTPPGKISGATVRMLRKMDTYVAKSAIGSWYLIENPTASGSMCARSPTPRRRAALASTNCRAFSSTKRSDSPSVSKMFNAVRAQNRSVVPAGYLMHASIRSSVLPSLEIAGGRRKRVEKYLNCASSWRVMAGPCTLPARLIPGAACSIPASGMYRLTNAPGLVIPRIRDAMFTPISRILQVLMVFFLWNLQYGRFWPVPNMCIVDISRYWYLSFPSPLVN